MSRSPPALSNAGSMVSSFTTPPTWVFTAAYVAFAALVAITWVAAPQIRAPRK